MRSGPRPRESGLDFITPQSSTHKYLANRVIASQHVIPLLEGPRSAKLMARDTAMLPTEDRGQCPFGCLLDR